MGTPKGIRKNTGKFPLLKKFTVGYFFVLIILQELNDGTSQRFMNKWNLSADIISVTLFRVFPGFLLLSSTFLMFPPGLPDESSGIF